VLKSVVDQFVHLALFVSHVCNHVCEYSVIVTVELIIVLKQLSIQLAYLSSKVKSSSAWYSSLHLRDSIRGQNLHNRLLLFTLASTFENLLKHFPTLLL
jgi:hypothetical protein